MAVDRQAVATALGGGDTATRLAEVAAQLVEKHTGEAVPPQEIEDEAAIRVAAYLRDAPAAARRVKTGDVEVETISASRAALRVSGAMSLLSPWVKRRGVAL